MNTDNYKYNRQKKRLTIYGTNTLEDLSISVKSLLKEEKIKADLTTIVYQHACNSTITGILQGVHLSKFFKNINKNKLSFTPSNIIDDIKTTQSSDFKNILNQINEISTLESSWAGLVVFCLKSRKFLFFKSRINEYWSPMGGYPDYIEESSIEILCRVGKIHGLGIVPEAITINLDSTEYPPTRYDNYMVFMNDEFVPKLNKNNSQFMWATLGTMGDKFRLHPAYKKLFDNDATIKSLINPPDMDFDLIVEKILSRDNDAPDIA